MEFTSFDSDQGLTLFFNSSLRSKCSYLRCILFVEILGRVCKSVSCNLNKGSDKQLAIFDRNERVHEFAHTALQRESDLHRECGLNE